MSKRKSTVIIDVTGNATTPYYEDISLFSQIDNQFGKGRGDMFQLATQIIPGTINKMRVAGGDINHFTEVFRPDYANAEFEIIETWQWTGRKWRQL